MKMLRVGVKSSGNANHNGRMSAGWITALKRHGVAFRWIDVRASSAIQSIRECDVFFCIINQDSLWDLNYLAPLLEVAERTGCLVYPDYHSRWHFDNKITQAWLFEALRIPVPRTWIFFSQESALEFIDYAEFPLVFKLSAGAGSQNVRAVANKGDARRLVRRMFGRGIGVYPFGPRFRKAVRARGSRSIRFRDARRLWTGLRRLTVNSLSKSNRHRGYVLFQELIPDNDCDHRVTVIGGRAFTYTRGVRENDFRASGSGLNSYPDVHEIDLELVRLAFSVQKKLKGDCIAMDFVRDPRDGAYKLLEISSGFIPDFVESCKGYFDREMNWFPGRWSPQECMVDDVLASLRG